MRVTWAASFLSVLLGTSFAAQGRRTASVLAARESFHQRRQQPQPQPPQPPQRQQQLSQLQQLGQVRGGATPPSAAALPRVSSAVTRVRGGRTSDAVVLAEALAETALESGLIVGFVGAAEFLVARFLFPAFPQFTEVSRLAVWTAAVFASGAATAGPRRWLDRSQLFNVDVPLDKEWYAKLRKPWFNPPNWLFPIMWIPLKILQVFACYEMWDKLEKRSCLAAPVVVYAIYKSLGDVWNKVFFERRRLKMGTVIISGYFALLLVGIKLFFDVDDRAGYLFAPTAAWVTVATCLQWSTWLLNRNQPHA